MYKCFNDDSKISLQPLYKVSILKYLPKTGFMYCHISVYLVTCAISLLLSFVCAVVCTVMFTWYGQVIRLPSIKHICYLV